MDTPEIRGCKYGLNRTLTYRSHNRLATITFVNGEYFTFDLGISDEVETLFAKAEDKDDESVTSISLTRGQLDAIEDTYKHFSAIPEADRAGPIDLQGLRPVLRGLAL